MGCVAVRSQRSGEHPIPKGWEGGWQHPRFLASQGMSQHMQVVFFHTLATVTIAIIFFPEILLRAMPQTSTKRGCKGCKNRLLALLLTVSRNQCESAGVGLSVRVTVWTGQ